MTATDTTPATGGRSPETEAFLTDLLEHRPVMYGPDASLTGEQRMRPRTEREEAALAAMSDPADMTVTQRRLEAVLESAIEMLRHVAAAPAAKWGDLAMGIYTAEGDFALSTSSGVQIFATTASPVPKFISRYWAQEDTVGVAEGDVYYHTDANYGGTHNADHTLLLPIFREGEHIAWVSAIIHEGESGATFDPGGLAARATTPYGEGLRIPPMKIGENHTLRRDVVNLFQNQVRDPLLWLVDIRAKLAACRRVEEHLHELMTERSADLLVATLRSVLEGTEAEVRRRIAAWADGTYRAVHFADSSLLDERLVKLAIEIEKRGERFVVRTHGSSPAIESAMNGQNHFTRAIVANVFMNFLYGDLPRNAGFASAIDVEIEPGSILAATPEHATSVSLITEFSLHSALHLAVTKAMFAAPGGAEPISPWFPQIPSLQYGGLSQHMQVTVGVTTEMNAAGGGARRDRDGEHACAPFFAPVSDWGELEMREAETPLLCLWRRIPQDNHGFGRTRGGASVEWAYMLYGSSQFALGVTTMGGRFPAVSGLFGGYGVPCTPLTVVRPEGGIDAVREWLADGAQGLSYDAGALLADRPLPASYEVSGPVRPVDLAAEGDIWILRVGGSGGYGDPLERDPDAVMTDLRRGLISEDVARDVYRVVWDEERLEADAGATERARAEEIRARLARGRTYDEFVAQWRRDVPPEGTGYLGSWGWDEQPG